MRKTEYIDSAILNKSCFLHILFNDMTCVFIPHTITQSHNYTHLYLSQALVLTEFS